MGLPFCFFLPSPLLACKSPARRNSNEQLQHQQKDSFASMPGEEAHPTAAPLLQVHESNKDSGWNAVVGDLLENGVALLYLKLSSTGTSCSGIPKAAFDSSIKALNLLEDDISDRRGSALCQMIEESADSAHVTGYHRAGCMSARYNAYREGFVFSDGQLFEVRGCTSFRSDCFRMQELLHGVAERVLAMICRHLELPEGWFHDKLGPLRDNSQWHIKRYVDVLMQENASQTTEASSGEDTECAEQGNSVEWLPTHTDPSLISVVVLNQPGRQEGSSGLQYSKNKIFLDVPWSGHEIVIAFVGSLLQHVTGGYFRACRHRVVYTNDSNSNKNVERMAATLFVRPAPERTLSLPPSPVLHRMNCKVKGCLTFSQWNAKVARNYEKAKKRRSARSK